MGNICTNSFKGDEAKQNNELEEWLSNQQVENMLEWKVLILGAGESGKSTVIKQLKSIYRIKPEESELNTAAAAIHYNTLAMMKILIANQREFGFDLYEPMPERAVALSEERERRKSEAIEPNGDDRTTSVPNSPRGTRLEVTKETDKEKDDNEVEKGRGKQATSLKKQTQKNSLAQRREYEIKRRAERRKNRKAVHRMRREADAASATKAKGKKSKGEANGDNGAEKEEKDSARGKGKEKKGKKGKGKDKHDFDKLAEMVYEYNIDESGDNRLPFEVGAAIDVLWRESGGIRRAYEKRNSFWFLDSADYYFENVMRYVESDYRPTEEDLIMARVMTTGILETTFKDTQSPVNFKVFDVGGQRNERRKWMHCFDNVKCILFVASLPGYDQVLMEDTRKNRMLESIELFAEIANNELFKETPIFLILNKKDLFESMLRVRGLEQISHYSDYTGPNTYHESLEYLVKRFRAVAKDPSKPVEVYDISTRLRSDVKQSWEAVKKNLVESNKKIITEAEKEKRKRARRVAKEAKKAAKRNGEQGPSMSNDNLPSSAE